MKKTITGLLVIAIVFFVFYAFLCYAWIGAEYRLEGAVHFGMVDKFAAFSLCGIAVDYIFGSAKRKKNGTEGKYMNP
ncbi:MAG: hypothetical protein IJZ39_07120 [Oscillospiraceae bacterium]|nr:hypothetical protein [Oscillospiraceae bacterium]